MKRPVLIAGIGNIFQGDDAFGVEVARKLAKLEFPENVRVMDAGIRGMDLAFALLEEYECIVLVDATARGGAPGTLYTIEIDPDDMPEASPANAHSLDPVRVLGLAKSMGAQFRKVLLVGCEPLVLDRDESGYIGLSEPVAAAVEPAVRIIRDLAGEFTRMGELVSHESA
ncbi:MAG TPA: hydrogenase maturation protease [Bryobacteraceae bacterium]